MIDIHCHILPGVDDGAADLEEALAMARLAAGCGVTDVAATPHFRGMDEELEVLPRFLRQLEKLRHAISAEEIPLRLHPGAEILCLPETVALAREGRLPTLGDTRYVLCEFFFDAPYEYMDRILSGIAGAGCKVVIAHPERYEAIIRDPRGAQRWFRKGYVIQMNKGSALGAFGGRVQQAARWLLDSGCVHIIASDAHSPRRRTTELSLLRSWLLERYPEEYVRILLEDNPARLLQDGEMVPVESY